MSPFAPAKRKRFSRNALIGIGLWAALWAGYYAFPVNLFDPRFPANTIDLIQGLRAYVPIMGAWVALILILVRFRHVKSWIGGALGWVMFYAIVGLASSVFVSIDVSDATYFGCMYLSIVIVLLAIVLVPNPLSDLRHVLTFTWIVGVVLTLGLLGVIPGLGRGALSGYEAPRGLIGAHQATGEILGMASRNTGFARYAAISGIVALARVWEGNRLVRLFWAVIFGASFYSLLIANGRTEVASFVASAFLVMFVQKARRTFFLIGGAAAAVLLGIEGFYGWFFLYLTRTGRLDVTMTGRTRTWEEGWKLFLRSPWWGFGFQADRFYLEGQHMHNAFLHALVQSGVLGGGALILALLAVWWLTIKYFLIRQPRDKSLVPPEIPGVLLFVTFSSFTESTFAYYSAAWLLSAPIFAYVLALDHHMRRSSAKLEGEREFRRRAARRSFRGSESPQGIGVGPPAAAEGTGH